MTSILLINGSPLKNKEKSNTRTLLQEVANAIKKNSKADLEFIDLVDYKIDLCTGCGTCVKGSCPLSEKDDMPKLENLVLNADTIVLASPSYWAGPSGLLKNFMDRTRPLKMPKSRLINKLASAVSVAGLRNGGQEQVINAINLWALGHGMLVIGACSDPYRTAPFPMGTISYETEDGKHKFRSVRKDTMAMADAHALGERITSLVEKIKV